MPLRVDRAADGTVALLTLDSPETRNAISAELATVIAAEVAQADADPEIRVVVIIGADPAFCSGIDLRDVAAGREIPLDFVDVIARARTPILAAVNGPAATGGLELALACHLRFASERAVFFDLHAQLGLFPRAGLSARLPRLVGASTALDLALTGRRVPATEALMLGLVDRLLPHPGFSEAVTHLAATIAAVDPELAARVVALYRSSAQVTVDEALAAELVANREWHATSDHRSGVDDRFRLLRERR